MVKPSIEQVNLMLAKQVKTVFIGVDDGIDMSPEIADKFYKATGVEVMHESQAYQKGSGSGD